MRVLIVCTGNTCRSPMAGGLLRKIASQKGVPVEVRTAGLAHHANTRVAEKAVAVMEEIGIDISDEYSKPVTPEALEWADIIIPIQRNHGAHLLEDNPQLKQRIRFLDYDVIDPYNGSISDYRERRDQLESLLARISFGG